MAGTKTEVKVVLDRNNKTNSGVWIDGVRLKYVKEVTVYGSALDIPQVVITMVPDVVTIDAYDPHVDEIKTNEKN